MEYRHHDRDRCADIRSRGVPAERRTSRRHHHATPAPPDRIRRPRGPAPLANIPKWAARPRPTHEARRAIHYRRIVDDGAIYSQPFSEGGAAAAGGVAFGTEAKPVEGGWIVNGKKIFASLSGHADYYGVLCTEMAPGAEASRRNTLYLALPARSEGISVVGAWDPLAMRGTVSRTLLIKDVF